jgi:hypothetical protein
MCYTGFLGRFLVSAFGKKEKKRKEKKRKEKKRKEKERNRQTSTNALDLTRIALKISPTRNMVEERKTTTKSQGKEGHFISHSTCMQPTHKQAPIPFHSIPFLPSFLPKTVLVFRLAGMAGIKAHPHTMETEPFTFF